MGLKFVQFMKNTSHHSGINQTPYKALFGCDPRIGLRSSSLPTEVIKTMLTEEDLLAAFSQNPELDSARGLFHVASQSSAATEISTAPVGDLIPAASQ